MSPTRPNPVELLEVFEAIDDHAPTTAEDEAELPPPEAMAASLAHCLGRVAQGMARSAPAAQEILEAKRPALDAAVRTIERRVVKRSRAENLSLLAALSARSPARAQALAHYRDFERASDEDLDSLVANLEALEALE